jgi:KipI family sensor histidine kinase inhibitor
VRTDLIPIRTADDTFELSVETSQQAHLIAAALRQAALGEDVVAGLNSVAIHFAPHQAKAIEALLLNQRLPKISTVSAAEIDEIEVKYGGEHGPDFDAVCDTLNLSAAEFIELHSDRLHTVEMIGFTPGFAYLSGLPDTFQIPRLASPRPRLPAGSIGISGAFTGIYALDGPGGWPLIGRTRAKLFNLSRDEPFLLQPGQQVRFRSG